MAKERTKVYFSGSVQGVGFRYTTLRVSRNFDVSGYVKNLRDGRVEVVAEGESDELDRFLGAIQQAMAGYITDQVAHRSAGTGEFSDFTISH